MTIPYVCEGTLIKTPSGREGMVITVDRKAKIAIVTNGIIFFTERLENIKVLSYREVE